MIYPVNKENIKVNQKEEKDFIAKYSKKVNELLVIANRIFAFADSDKLSVIYEEMLDIEYKKFSILESEGDYDGVFINYEDGNGTHFGLENGTKGKPFFNIEFLSADPKEFERELKIMENEFLGFEKEFYKWFDNL